MDCACNKDKSDLVAISDKDLRELAFNVKDQLEYWSKKITSQLSIASSGQSAVDVDMLLTNIARVYEFLPVKHKITKTNKTMIDCLMHKHEAKFPKKVKTYNDFNGYNADQN